MKTAVPQVGKLLRTPEPFQQHSSTTRTQNSELRILFNIIHEDCNKLVIVTIIKITVIKGKKYETKYIILFNKKKL